MVRRDYCRRHLGDEKAFAEPGTTEKGPRERSFKVHHLRLDITLDVEGRRVAGTSTLTLSPINDGLTWVELDAVDMTIHRVRGDDGTKLAFDHAGGKLLVHLQRPMGPTDKLSLVVEYEATPRKGLFFITPDAAHPDKRPMVWAQGEAEENRWWFPCYDATNDRMTSEVHLTVPARFTGLSNGRLESVTEDATAGAKTYHWVMDVPHATYLVAVAAAEFDSEEERVGEVPLQYFVPKGYRDFIPRSFGNTADMFRFLEETTGQPYPYAKYGQVCVEDFVAGGMENTSLTILYKETLHPEAAHPDYMSEALVAHELAHQWFGDLVTCKSWGDLWLNEGFASYFDPLWWEPRWGRDEFEQRMREDLQWYFEEASEKYTRPIVTHGYTDPDDMFDGHTYAKGAWVLHMLRYILGDELFFKAIRHYLARSRLQAVETNDLKEAIEEATGRSLEWFFKEWLYKGGHPEYEVSWEWDPGPAMVALKVAQKQKVTETTPLFRMPIEVELMGEGSEGKHVIQVEKSEETFYLPADRRPRAVLFDPRGWIVKTVKFRKEKEELLHQLRGSTTLAMKAEACEGLGKISGDPEVVAALAATLREEPFWGVRLAAAKALGALGTPDARAILVAELTAQGDSRVRRAIAEAVGEVRGSEAFDGLVAAFPSEPKDYPAAAMVKAAAKTKDSRAFDWMTGEPLRRRSHMEVVRRGVLEGLAEMRDPKGIGVCEAHIRYGEDPWLRATAADVLGRLGEVLEDRRRDIRDILLPILKDREYRVRRAAVTALGRMKDPANTQALEAVEEGEIFGQIRRAARQAIRQIRQAQEAKAQKAEAEKALNELKDENRELKARIAKVEARVEILGKGKRRGAPRRRSGAPGGDTTATSAAPPPEGSG